MKLKLLRERPLLTIFFLQKVTKNQNLTKELFFETAGEFLTSLLTLRRRLPHTWCFMNYFSFSELFTIFCPSWNIRPSPLHSGLHSKLSRWNFCRLDALVCCCAANQYSEIGSHFSKIKRKTVITLTVNKNKVTSRNASIDHLFALEGDT